MGTRGATGRKSREDWFNRGFLRGVGEAGVFRGGAACRVEGGAVSSATGAVRVEGGAVRKPVRRIGTTFTESGPPNKEGW